MSYFQERQQQCTDKVNCVGGKKLRHQEKRTEGSGNSKTTARQGNSSVKKHASKRLGHQGTTLQKGIMVKWKWQQRDRGCEESWKNNVIKIRKAGEKKLPWTWGRQLETAGQGELFFGRTAIAVDKKKKKK